MLKDKLIQHVPSLRKIAFGALFISMTASGLIDTYRLLVPSLNTFQMYSNEDLSLVQWILDHTDPHSVWLTGGYHNNFLYNITGRPALMTYEGWLWTHGYDYEEIRSDLLDMLAVPEWKDLYRKHGIDFILVGPVEIDQWEANLERLKSAFKAVKVTDNYMIFSTGRSPLLKEEPKAIEEGEKLSAYRDLSSDFYLRPGLDQRIYPNIYFSGRSKRRVQLSGIDFRYESDQDRPLFQPCSIEWDGFLRVSTAGEYEFILESDDGSWLTLNDRPIIDNGGRHSMKRVTRKVYLEKGFHKLQIRYFDATGGAVFYFKWIPPGQIEQIVDSDMFSRDVRFKDSNMKLLLD